MEVIDLHKVKEGFFDSNGFANIAITKDGKKKHYRIPIRTTNNSEVMKQFNEKYQEPKPPVIFRLVKEEAGNIVLAKRGERGARVVKIFDETDEKYSKAKEEYQEKAILATVLVALDLDDKYTVDQLDEFKEWLSSIGLVGQHLMDIAKAVRNLNEIDEEQKDDDIKKDLDSIAN